jgi:hypothetical protein
MAGSSATLHESPERLGPETIDRHRAIVSIMEELEAIDWYDQRAKASDDDALREVLEHNRDDEKEHEELRRYLFTEGSITERALEAVAGEQSDGDGGSLGIGSLRVEVTP